MAVETTNLLLITNLLQRANLLQKVNTRLVPTQIIPPGPSFNPAFISSGVSAGSGSTAVTITTTGATLLVAILSAVVDGTISDSVGGQTNAWHYLTSAVQTDGNHVRIAYAYAATGGGALNSGSSHVLTMGGTDCVGVVYAFSGTATTSAVLDQSNQTSNATSNQGQVYNVQAGSITPTVGALVIMGAGNNGTLFGSSTDTLPTGFTGERKQTSGANYEIVAGCYKLNDTGSAENPTWVVNLNAYTGAVIASFV